MFGTAQRGEKLGRFPGGLALVLPALEVGPLQPRPAAEEDENRRDQSGRADAEADPDGVRDAGGRLRREDPGEVEDDRTEEEGGDSAQELDQREHALDLGGSEREARDEEAGGDRGADPEPEQAGPDRDPQVAATTVHPHRLTTRVFGKRGHLRCRPKSNRLESRKPPPNVPRTPT